METPALFPPQMCASVISQLFTWENQEHALWLLFKSTCTITLISPAHSLIMWLSKGSSIAQAVSYVTWRLFLTLQIINNFLCPSVSLNGLAYTTDKKKENLQIPLMSIFTHQAFLPVPVPKMSLLIFKTNSSTALLYLTH